MQNQGANNEAFSRKERMGIRAVAAMALGGLVAGWMLFWFLTDDALISFRYVANSILGYGYVWNPPPFRPVEGYTSFLWVVSLDAAWRIAGVVPTESSTVLSFLFSGMTLLVAGRAMLRWPWHGALARQRVSLTGLVLLGTLTNRTFLAWTSSGLETAMFNFFLTAWVLGMTTLPLLTTRRILIVSLTATAMALTRPDGLLFCAVTLATEGLALAVGRGRSGPRRWMALTPFLLVCAHVGWRRWFYGEWLPNTYYAKFAALWPESGLRYLASFVLEYALWVWIALALYVGLRRRRSWWPAAAGESWIPAQALARLAAPAALLLHAGYYVIAIGGDHFEFRVFSHLIVLAFVSFAWLLDSCRLRPAVALALLSGFILLSWPVPWTHWALSAKRTTVADTHMLTVRLAEHWPAPVRWYARAFDNAQAWLIEHYVCLRHQEHKVVCDWWLNQVLPSRAQGSTVPPDGHPVMEAFGGIGGLGWVLPHVNIIDMHGLNDYVIARTPPPARMRKMAHERTPPAGYVERFRPNVSIKGRQVDVVPRAEPLTGEDIIRAEREWRVRIRNQPPAAPAASLSRPAISGNGISDSLALTPHLLRIERCKLQNEKFKLRLPACGFRHWQHLRGPFTLHLAICTFQFSLPFK